YKEEKHQSYWQSRYAAYSQKQIRSALFDWRDYFRTWMGFSRRMSRSYVCIGRSWIPGLALSYCRSIIMHFCVWIDQKAPSPLIDFYKSEELFSAFSSLISELLFRSCVFSTYFPFKSSVWYWSHKGIPMI